MTLITLAWVLAFTSVVLIACSIFIVDQQTKRVVTRFGKFVKIGSPGLNFKVPLLDSVSAPLSLRIRQLMISETTYTDKGTSVSVTANIQYVVGDSDQHVELAFYKLEKPEGQIKSHVSSSIRNKVPQMSLENVQKNQGEIAEHVKQELTSTMAAYGYVITDVLITSVEPDPTVVQANNEKYASEQARVTAENLAQSAYIQTVRDAEAEEVAAITRGEGAAGERSAVISGLQESVKSFEEGVPGATARDAMVLLAFSRLMDAQVKIAQAPNTKVIFVPAGSGDGNKLLSDVRSAMISGAEATR